MLASQPVMCKTLLELAVKHDCWARSEQQLTAHVCQAITKADLGSAN